MKNKIPKTDFEKLGEAMEKFKKEFDRALKESFIFRWIVRMDNFKFSIKELFKRQ